MLETNLSAAIEKNILGKKKDLQVFFIKSNEAWALWSWNERDEREQGSMNETKKRKKCHYWNKSNKTLTKPLKNPYQPTNKISWQLIAHNFFCSRHWQCSEAYILKPTFWIKFWFCNNLDPRSDCKNYCSPNVPPLKKHTQNSNTVIFSLINWPTQLYLGIQSNPLKHDDISTWRDQKATWRYLSRWTSLWISILSAA